MKLNAKELRTLDTSRQIPEIKRLPIYFILDNIYDTYNIGGLFRLADAISASGIYICGESEIPPNHKIKKASIGTYKVVPWVYKKSTIEAIEELRNKFTLAVISVEQHKKAVSYINYNYIYPLALILGNETNGVSKEALDNSDAIVEIPMYGINKSLNVIVSASIVSYHILTNLK